MSSGGERTLKVLGEYHSYIRTTGQSHITWFAFNVTLNLFALNNPQSREFVPPWVMFGLNLAAAVVSWLIGQYYKKTVATMRDLDKFEDGKRLMAGAVPLTLWRGIAITIVVVCALLALAWLVVWIKGAPPSATAPLVSGSS